MGQQGIKGRHPDNEAEHAPKKERFTKRHWYHLDPKYWIESPIGSIFLTVALTLMSTFAPEKSATKVYLGFAAIWILVGGVLFWIAHGIANRNIPTEDEISRQKEERDAKHREHIQSQIENINAKASALQSELQETKRHIYRQSRRGLTQAQKVAIHSAISPYARAMRVKVCCFLSDTEASQYASVFLRVFMDAGWGLYSDTVVDSRPPLDVRNILIVSHNNPASEAVTTLAAVLTELEIIHNVAFTKMASSNTDGGFVEVWVGAIPSPE